MDSTIIRKIGGKTMLAKIICMIKGHRYFIWDVLFARGMPKIKIWKCARCGNEKRETINE